MTSGVCEKSSPWQCYLMPHGQRSSETEEQMGVKEVSRGDEQGLVFMALKHHSGHSCIAQEALSSSSFLFIEI